ncbi:biotin carboxylase N-terminal domain-containing protein [Paucibacter sp. AS339]|uniref:acetyl/propionyl/methylcrotonyl-CoA carboxylase subunit alpha n=1 Tax=Paucibacter hankyongi TaxID=3133434 RepID=UPI0030AD6CE3
MSFSKILIANRGEIACRIMRTARRLGYRCVAVYSDADRGAPHVLQADEAVHIGASPAAQSYLNIEAILAAARATGADAIHPGYGFLSERADFAQACVDAGLVFIGPPAASILAMGNKAGAKRRMLAAGVPCAPGYLGEQQDEACLQREAEALGFPLLVKAVAGGGGRGMRLALQASELAQAIAGARREAETAFGDGTLMLERLIQGGRHIEVQIFADHQGNAVHLGERDCTAQRRRQKVIEEAPSPIVSPAMREAMGRDAVAAALAVGYVGAGTVEFIVDAELKHYFLEMNTRLQVEHPVTEAITGLDLVEWQLRVAAGEALPLAQSEIQFEGHAIEARLYAEDPYSGFAPQTGRIAAWRPEGAAPGVRIDAGICEGGEISPFYDAMVAKLIVHGRDRVDARRRLAAALEDLPLLGVKNNGRFLRDLLRHPDFAEARMHTGLIDEWALKAETILQAPQPDARDWWLAAGLTAVASLEGKGQVQIRPLSVQGFDLSLQCGQARQVFRVACSGLKVALSRGTETHHFELLSQPGAKDESVWTRVRLDGIERRLICRRLDDAESQGGFALHLVSDAACFVFSEPSAYPAQGGRSQDDPMRACAPVAGLVAQVLVRVGDEVSEGQALMSVEAMKMEMWLSAGAAGRVKAIHAAPKDAVAAGALLIELASKEQDAEA